MIKQELSPSEFSTYHSKYINLVSKKTDLKTGYTRNKKIVIEFFSSIPKKKLEYRYQPEKWTIKEILQHIIDTERIFIYRILVIARKDKTPLQGYDQNIYIEPSEANTKTLNELIHEFSITRLYSMNLMNSISEENLKNIGIVDNSNISARACAFLLLGHSIWHMNIIKEKYL